MGSPDLFNLYSEIVMRVNKPLGKINISGQNNNNFTCTNDTAVVTDPEELQS